MTKILPKILVHCFRPEIGQAEHELVCELPAEMRGIPISRMKTLQTQFDGDLEIAPANSGAPRITWRVNLRQGEVPTRALYFARELRNFLRLPAVPEVMAAAA
jgi:hypothetical protein